jgi:hypothetical protein
VTPINILFVSMTVKTTLITQRITVNAGVCSYPINDLAPFPVATLDPHGNYWVPWPKHSSEGLGVPEATEPNFKPEP